MNLFSLSSPPRNKDLLPLDLVPPAFIRILKGTLAKMAGMDMVPRDFVDLQFWTSFPGKFNTRRKKYPKNETTEGLSTASPTPGKGSGSASATPEAASAEAASTEAASTEAASAQASRQSRAPEPRAKKLLEGEKNKRPNPMSMTEMDPKKAVI